MLGAWLVTVCHGAPDLLGELPWSEGWSGVVGVTADGAVVGWQGQRGGPRELVRAYDGEPVEVIAESAIAAAVSGDGRVVGWVVAPGDLRLEIDGRVETWLPDDPIDDLRPARDRVVGIRVDAIPTDAENWEVEQDFFVGTTGTFSALSPAIVADRQGSARVADCPSPGPVYDRRGETWISCGRGLVPVPPVTGSPGFLAAPPLDGGRSVRSPDGRFLASCDGGRVVRVDPETGARLDDVGHGRPIVAMDGSRNGRFLVSADDRGEVLTWDPSTGRVLDHRRLDGRPVAVAVRDDGRTAVRLESSGGIETWGAGLPAERLPVPPPRTREGTGASIEDLEFARTQARRERVAIDARILGGPDAAPADPRCTDLDGFRWCSGGTPDLGPWREAEGRRTFVPLAPSASTPRAVHGGLVLPRSDADWFVRVTNGEAKPPVRMSGGVSKVSAPAGSAWARALDRGRIALVPLAGERPPEPAPPPVPAPEIRPAPVRGTGSGPPVTMVLAIDGTGSFRDEIPFARAAGQKVLDALEGASSPEDRVGLVTFHHRYAQIRSPLVATADPEAARALREALSRVDVASKPTRDGWHTGGDRPESPREYPDEAGSDPSTGLVGALALLSGTTGRRVILLVTDGFRIPPGPGLLRDLQPYAEARWPEIVNAHHPDEGGVFHAGVDAADQAEAAGIEVWVLAVDDPRSCELARPFDRCMRATGAELPFAAAGWAAGFAAR